MLAPFLKAKRALFFSKIVDKNYGAGLVVSENHLSGALFESKKSAIFSKIVDKNYGAGLVVSKNHLSGALFHFNREIRNPGQ